MPSFIVTLLRPNVTRMAAKRDVVGLIKALRYQSPADEESMKVRKAAVEALGAVGDTRAVDPLIAALEDMDRDVRAAAAETLGKMGGGHTAQALIAALKDKDRNVRQAARDALDRLGWKPGQDETSARYWIALGEWEKCIQIGAPATEPLIAALKGQDVDNMLAAQALARTGWTPGQNETSAWYWMALGKTELCAKIGAPAVEPLVAMIQNNDGWGGQGLLVHVLANTHAPQAVEPLIAMLNGKDVFLRKYVVNALAELGDSRAVQPLVDTLRDTENDWIVRENAARALEKFGWQPKQDSTGAWYWAARGDADKCAQVGAPALDPLITLLLEKNDTRAGKALVRLYKSTDLSELDKKRILQHRQKIQSPVHADRTTSHVDNDYYYNGKCGDGRHEDSSNHTDQSRPTVDFPL